MQIQPRESTHQCALCRQDAGWLGAHTCSGCSVVMHRACTLEFAQSACPTPGCDVPVSLAAATPEPRVVDVSAEERPNNVAAVLGLLVSAVLFFAFLVAGAWPMAVISGFLVLSAVSSAGGWEKPPESQSGRFPAAPTRSGHTTPQPGRHVHHRNDNVRS